MTRSKAIASWVLCPLALCLLGIERAPAQVPWIQCIDPPVAPPGTRVHLQGRWLNNASEVFLLDQLGNGSLGHSENPDGCLSIVTPPLPAGWDPAQPLHYAVMVTGPGGVTLVVPESALARAAEGVPNYPADVVNVVHAGRSLSQFSGGGVTYVESGGTVEVAAPPGNYYLLEAGATLDLRGAGPAVADVTVIRAPGAIVLGSGYEEEDVPALRMSPVRELLRTGPVPQSIDLTVNVTGNGTVTRSPAKARYYPGDVVTLAGVGEPGWGLQRWIRAGQDDVVEDALTLTLESDTVVEAEFVEGASITIADSPGTVTIAPRLNVYPIGTEVTLTFAPAPGFRFRSWAGDLPISRNPLVFLVAGETNVSVITSTPEVGRHLWTFDTGEERANDQFSEMCIDRAGNIIVGYAQNADGGGGSISSISRNGTLNWKQQIFYTGWSAPVIGPDGTIYVPGYGRAYAFDADGTKLWEQQLLDPDPRIPVAFLQTPYVTRSNLLYQPYADFLSRLNPATGRVEWRFQHSGSHAVTGTLDGNLYFATGGSLNKLTAEGDLLERVGARTASYRTPASINGKGHLHWAMGASSSPMEINIYDDVQRINRLTAYRFISFPPIFDHNDHLYFTNRDQDLIALRDDYSPKWSLPGIQDGPMILTEDGTLYAAGGDPKEQVIFALDAETRATLWRSEAGLISDPTGKLPTYAGDSSSSNPWVRLAVDRAGVLYAASSNGKIYAFQGSAALATSSWPKQYAGYENESTLLAKLPIITEEPDSQALVAGDTLTLTVESTGIPSPVVDWFHNGVRLGAQGKTLQVSNIHPNHGGEYHALLSNAAGTVRTETAQVEVLVRLQSAVSGFGSVQADPEGAPVVPGTQVTVTAVPDPGYEFIEWQDSASGSENPLVVLLDTSKSVRAVFRDVVAPEIILGHADSIEVTVESYELQARVSDNVGVTRVRVWRDDVFVGEPAIGGDGTLTMDDIALVFGPNLIRLEARDAQGNETRKEFTVNWVPGRILEVRVQARAQQAREFPVRIWLTSDGEVGGLHYELTYDPTYLLPRNTRSPFPTFLPNATGIVNAGVPGVLSVTLAQPAIPIPAGETILMFHDFSVRSVPSDISVPFELRLISIASPLGEPFPAGTEVMGSSVILEPSRIVGDGNNNGRIDVNDANGMLSRLAGIGTIQPWDIPANDLNGNGLFEIGDALYALAIVAGLHPQPQPPVAPGRAPGEGYDFDAPRVRLNYPPPGTPAGSTIDVAVHVENPGSALRGTSFFLDYPVESLRLEDAGSHQRGSLVAPDAFAIWNVAPAQNDYVNQSGTVAFATASTENWPDSAAGGEIARFTFTVPEGAGVPPINALTIRGAEISTEEEEYAVIPIRRTSAHLSLEAISYADWVLASFSPEERGLPEFTDAHFDPDLDGRINFLEYFHGSLPTTPDTPESLRHVTLPGIDGSTRHGVVVRRDVRVPDVTWRLQRSADLQTWEEVEAIQVAESLLPESAVEELVLASPDARVGRDREFWRLVVESVAAD